MGKNPKGSNFENQTAKDVIAALAPIEALREEIFRTPLSGGHPYAPSGDLIVADRIRPFFPFTVECKNWKTWKAGSFWAPRQQDISWLDQTLREAEDGPEGNRPLLVCKGNATGSFAVIPKREFESLQWSVQFVPRMVFRDKGRIWIQVPWVDFLIALSQHAACQTPFPMRGYDFTRKKKHRH
jgi:hypothetical protein